MFFGCLVLSFVGDDFLVLMNLFMIVCVFLNDCLMISFDDDQGTRWFDWIIGSWWSLVVDNYWQSNF